MSHLDPSSLAQYNSLIDPHLQSYFSNERIQSHLKHAGLISGRGDIISEGEYRTRLTRREHKNHVRHVLAENIVNRAIDMERTRRAEMKRQFDMVSKAALVNNIKESRRRSGTFGGLMSNSGDMALLSLDSSWVKTRPKSANYQNETNGLTRSPRLQSAHNDDHHRGKSLSKTRDRRRSRRRLKNRSSSTQNHRSPTKYSDSSSNPCQITMVYYGPKIKVDYDHLVFEPIDEVIVMQQHCGGENIAVYKEHLKPGAEFTFDSRRHSDYPFGLTLYVKGYIDSRISTCCEYKHRHGVRLGGDRGHFAIKSVKGSKPCIKCRFEKQARLKRYAQSPKDKTNENKKPITIPLSTTDQRKVPQTPTKIPVRHTSTSKENYPEDFEGSDIQKRSNRDEYSSDEQKFRPKTSKSKRISPIIRKETRRRNSSTSDETPKEKIEKKTWQIKFYTANIPKEKNFSIKFSLISNDENNETETYEINKKQFDQNLKENKFYSFSIKLKNIGKPIQIRLKIYASNDDDDEDEDEDIKWYLDYIELIDQENKSPLIFPCKQSIQPLQEKILRLSQESPRKERVRKTSSSTNSSRPSSSNEKTRQKTSVRSSTLPIVLKKSDSVSRVSPDNQSDESTPRNNQENKVRYRVTVYPSNDDDGSFNPGRDSRIYLRLNNQTKKTNLRKKNDRACPTFESGEKQSFELDFIQNINEKPKKLTIGYVNSDITAMKWKIDKIVLVNLKTNNKFIFPCKRILHRDESNFRAEKTFDIQSNSSDDETTPRNRKTNSPTSDDEKQRKNDYNKRKSVVSQKLSDDDSDEEKTETRRRVQAKTNSTQKLSLLQKQNDDDSDEEKTTTPRNLQTKVDSTQKSSLLKKLSDDDSDEEKTETRRKVQAKTNSTQKLSLLQKLSDDDSDAEQTTTPRNLQTKVDSTQKSSLLKKLANEDSDEEQIETFKNPEIKTNNIEKPTLLQKQNNDSDEEQIETPPKPKIRTNNTEKSSSSKNLNDDDDNEEKIETPKNIQTNNYSKQKSPSFQSMNDEEAHYRTIFDKLDPDGKLKIGSRAQSPEPQPQSPEPRHQNSESRPKTRRGPQDQNNQQNSFQLVDPLVGLDELNNQTARSNDQLTQNSLPSTTTNNEEIPRKKRHPVNSDDTNEEDN